jgi:hypothetical protein
VRSSEALLLLRFITGISLISLITISVYCRFLKINVWYRFLEYRSVVVVYIT